MTKDGHQDTKGSTSSNDFSLEPGAQHHYKFKEPWTVLALDNIQGYLIQLACAGGSGAIAKTAVAPLERVKVINARHAACASRVCCICVGVVNWHCRGQHSGHFLQMHSVKFNIVREFVFAVAQEQFPDKLRTSHKHIACHLHYVLQEGGGVLNLTAQLLHWQG